MKSGCLILIIVFVGCFLGCAPPPTLVRVKILYTGVDKFNYSVVQLEAENGQRFWLCGTYYGESGDEFSISSERLNGYIPPKTEDEEDKEYEFIPIR